MLPAVSSPVSVLRMFEARFDKMMRVESEDLFVMCMLCRIGIKTEDCCTFFCCVSGGNIRKHTWVITTY